MLKIRRSLILFAIFILSAGIPTAQAITIDEFETGAQLVFDPPPVAGISNSSVVTSTGSLGGTRSIRTIKASGPVNNTVQLNIFGGIVSHSQGSTTTGASVITWDGDLLEDYADGNLSQPPTSRNGLQNLNLLQDGADAFRIVVSSFDQPAAGSVKIEILMFDGSEPTGNKYKICTKYKYQVNPLTDPNDYSALQDNPITTAITTNTIFLFPFAECADGQLLYPDASFSSVGAIVLRINNGTSAVDLDITSFGTNGECPTLPVNGTVYSPCGKCLSDPNPNDCVDCEGITFGDKDPGDICDTGDVGICKDGTYQSQVTYLINQQNCTCKGINDPGTEICDGLDNDCDGEVDESNGQGGNCLDCLGRLNGTAVLDKCGVCEGDNTSCLDCKDHDITELQFEMDHGAKLHERLIKNMLKALGKLDRSKATKQFTKLTKAKAHELQLRNWVLSWTMKSKITVCGNTALCTQESNLGVLDEYTTHSKELLELGNQVLGKLKKLKFNIKKFKKNNHKLHVANIGLASKVPTQFSIGCNL